MFGLHWYEKFCRQFFEALLYAESLRLTAVKTAVDEVNRRRFKLAV